MTGYVVEFGKDGGSRQTDARLDAPAFHRNHQAIPGVLERYLTGKSGDAVEVGSGTGQHVVEFAASIPGHHLVAKRSERQHLTSIEAWRMHSRSPNIRAPRRIDVSDPAWGDRRRRSGQPGELLAVFCANVLHIAPWQVAEGLVAGAGAPCTRTDAVPLWFVQARRTSIPPSNAAFDESLREGIPNGACAISRPRAAGETRRTFADRNGPTMPANNLTLVFRKT